MAMHYMCVICTHSLSLPHRMLITFVNMHGFGSAVYSYALLWAKCTNVPIYKFDFIYTHIAIYIN